MEPVKFAVDVLADFLNEPMPVYVTDPESAMWGAAKMIQMLREAGLVR